MKSGFASIEDFLQELQRIEYAKNDFVVPTSHMSMEDSGSIAVSGKKYDLNDIAHGQLADRLHIPRNYYGLTADVPGLREHNVNEMLKHRAKRFTVRTIDETARAVLSDRYLPVDNLAVIMETMPIFKEFPGVEIKAATLTDTKMYLQVVFPHTKREIVKGDAVQYGVTLTNSEVGLGAINIESTVWRLVCSNGMIGRSLINRRHVGRRIAEDENMELFRRETVAADMKAFSMKMADVIRHSLEKAQLSSLFAPISEAAEIPVEKPEDAVQNITKRYSLRDTEAAHVLRNMYQENNLTKWGLVNGVTNAARIIDSEDRQYELERIGNDLLHVSARDWDKISA